MGDQNVSKQSDAEQLRHFMKQLLNDLRALEKMHEDDMIETGVRRVGAEQEIFLVDRNYRPAPVSMEVLEELDDKYFTTELGRFNIECNLDPYDLGGNCLSRMENQIHEFLAQARVAAQNHDADIVLTGILPTLDKSDLSLANMTPMDRYYALNDAMNRLRADDYTFRIKGPDELIIRHENVMLESCNTSFQIHFQVGPEEFARLYNIAQAVTGPVLAAAANSPLLFGRRLWQETRIALFQQSIDTRSPTAHVREETPRVSFGRGWVKDSVLEIFQEDISRFRLLLAAEVEEDPFEQLEKGEAPVLKALRLHNSTVYRWNRPCYGIGGGKAHLRIENRVIPAGPTPRDEVANAAFYFGLMRSFDQTYGDITQAMSFDQAHNNFIAAARLGLAAQMSWPEHGTIPAQKLICDVLLPMAREGLAEVGIDESDIDRYLTTIHDRASSGQTGAQWMLDSLATFDAEGSKAERLAALTAATLSRQKEDKPGHEWELAKLEEAGGWARHYSRVEHLMTTDLFTVNEDDLVDLVAAMMDWEHIRHVPVEDKEHHLVGLVTHRNLLRLMARGGGRDTPIPVKEVMHSEVVTCGPDMPTLEAIALMRTHRIACLPVLQDGRLVGIVTERDFMNIAGQLLEQELQAR